MTAFHLHIVYLWHDAAPPQTCPPGYGHFATCEPTDPKKHPPISHEKCPKVHEMWVKSSHNGQFSAGARARGARARGCGRRFDIVILPGRGARQIKKYLLHFMQNKWKVPLKSHGPSQ